MRRPLPRISRDRADWVLLNPTLSRQLLSDLGYSCDYPEARAMCVGLLGHGWQAWLPAPKASRSEAMILAPNGRICRLDGDAMRTGRKASPAARSWIPKTPAGPWPST